MKFERALTDTVVLRDARVGDAAALADAHRRNREHLAPWDPERAPSFFEPGGQLAMLTARIAAAEAGEQQPFHLMEGERVVGTIALNQIVRGPLQKASVGYWVDRERTGQGLAKAALAVVVEVAATRLRLHRLEASALPHNVGSRAVLAASGFEQYGTAPGYLRIAGEWREHVLYQRLLDETQTRGL